MIDMLKGCEIDGEVFVRCPQQKAGSFSIPDGITCIGEDAFMGCGLLTDIHIPASVRHINDYAFYECTRLRYVNIPDAVTFIPPFCFMGCKALTEIHLSPDIAEVGELAFANCSSLTLVKGFRACQIGANALLNVRECITVDEYRMRTATRIASDRAGEGVEAVGMHSPSLSTCVTLPPSYEIQN